jgi:hypothetical protein
MKNLVHEQMEMDNYILQYIHYTHLIVETSKDENKYYYRV